MIRVDPLEMISSYERDIGISNRGGAEPEIRMIIRHSDCAFLKGFQGHHINDVAHHDLKMAADPNNIKFVEGWEGNLAEHEGNFQNETKGALIDRLKSLSGSRQQGT